MTTRGRPKILTDEQRTENRKNYQKQYSRDNRTRLNTVINNYNAQHRQTINDQQNERYRKKALLIKEQKADPFYIRNYEMDDIQKNGLKKMAELVKIGCSEKKTKGVNYLYVTAKRCHIRMMNDIGFLKYPECWISSSCSHIAMKIIGWKDIKLKRIYYDKMVMYGILKWKLGIITPITNIILSYLEFKPMEIR